jgi:hypothetical protein
MRQIQVVNGFGDVPRFVRIQRIWRPFPDRAEPTVPRANVAPKHEGRSAVGPTLKDVRTTSFLTDCVKIQTFDQLQHVLLIRRIAEADLQPFWLRLARSGVADNAKFAAHSSFTSGSEF